MSAKLLKPYQHPVVKDKLMSAQDRQASYYNKISRPLPEIQPGDVVRLKLPGENIWSKAARLHLKHIRLNIKVEHITGTAKTSNLPWKQEILQLGVTQI